MDFNTNSIPSLGMRNEKTLFTDNLTLQDGNSYKTRNNIELFHKENNQISPSSNIKFENFLTYSFTDKIKLDQNLIIIDEIHENQNFVRLVDRKNYEETTIFLCEKPNCSLKEYLIENKEDIFSRFFLFKQSFDIVFKLIMLKENFLFFNYSLFYVNIDKKNEIENTNMPKNFELKQNFSELKIFYHSKNKFFIFL